MPKSWAKKENLSQSEGKLCKYVIPKLSRREINSRTNGHRSNALFKYEKPNLDQQRKVGEILGPPERLDVNEHPSEDAKETEFLMPKIDFDISDELLCNIPTPGDVP